MPAVYQAIAGDTTTTIQATCIDAETELPIDLSNKTANLYWRYAGGTRSTAKVMTLPDDLTTGVVTYQFLTGELVSCGSKPKQSRN